MMKMWKFVTLFFILLVSFSVQSQNLQRPRLVVGIVVDQMRWDYLYRFYDRYGTGGFKRLLRDGFSCENTMIPYTPTSTAPGHSTIYTGTVPALHGIMGNSWYDPIQKRIVYCTEDNTAKAVGSSSSAGRMSPKNMLASTITDELRLVTNFRSKTVSIALKDRGSILPGGHSSNGSYWFDNAIGGMISSTYYMQELPQWVKAFNEKKLPDAYLKQPWNTLYPINSYIQSAPDSNSYESRITGEDNTFPHRTDTMTSNRYEAFRYTPSGSTYIFDMGRAAIVGEALGTRNVTDFLALSLSSPDYTGHSFSPNSVEVEDTYLRLDRDIAAFLNYLDGKVGKGQYLVFLTADHAAANNPAFMRDHRMTGGSFEMSTVRRQLNDSLQKRFNAGRIIEQWTNYQIHLDDSVIRTAGLNRNEVIQYITDQLIRQPAILFVVETARLSESTLVPQVKMMLTNGYNQKLSGDLQLVMRPQWFDSWSLGTSHGQWNPYDAHIPLLWYGWKIKKGKSSREVYMTDIAPTLAALLQIQMPNASVGKVISELTADR